MALDSSADTLPKLLVRNARRHGARPAIREKRRGIWRTTSWSDLAADAGAVAAALSARGLRRGAHVAIISENRPRMFSAMAAVQALGAIAAPLYHDAGAEELRPWLLLLAPTHVFAENQEQVDKVLAILPECPSITCVVYDQERGLGHYRDERLVSRAALAAEGADGATEGTLESFAAAGAAGEPAFVFFTAGTGGDAKAVVHSHASLLDRAAAAEAEEGFGETDTIMAYLSPGWAGQTIFTYVVPFHTGACVCCPESSDTMLDDLREIAPTRMVFTPRVLELVRNRLERRIADTGGLMLRLFRRGMARGEKGGSALYRTLLYAPLRDKLGLSRIRSAYAAGDTIDPELIGFFRTLGIEIRKLYGATETGYFDALQSDSPAAANTIGKPTPGTEITLSQDGEILVKSGGLFLGYLGDDAATSRARDEEGRFRTGDHGVEENGRIRIIDRVADMGHFIDGTPFSPKQVERRLVAFAEIGEAVAIGDGRDGVCALIDIDTASVAKWADGREISFTGHADLAGRPEVGELIRERVADVNADLAKAAHPAGHRIRRFVLLSESLTPDSGLLTPTGKARRALIARRYAAVIQALYAAAGTGAFRTADGETVELTLWDAEPPGAADGRKAA